MIRKFLILALALVGIAFVGSPLHGATGTVANLPNGQLLLGSQTVRGTDTYQAWGTTHTRLNVVYLEAYVSSAPLASGILRCYIRARSNFTQNTSTDQAIYFNDTRMAGGVTTNFAYEVTPGDTINVTIQTAYGKYGPVTFKMPLLASTDKIDYALTVDPNAALTVTDNTSASNYTAYVQYYSTSKDAWVTVDSVAQVGNKITWTSTPSAISAISPGYDPSLDSEWRLLYTDSLGNIVKSGDIPMTTSFAPAGLQASAVGATLQANPFGNSQNTFTTPITDQQAVLLDDGSISHSQGDAPAHSVVVSTTGTATDSLTAQNQQLGVLRNSLSEETAQTGTLGEILNLMRDNVAQEPGESSGGGLTDDQAKDLGNIADDVHTLAAGDSATLADITGDTTPASVSAQIGAGVVADQMQTGHDLVPDISGQLTGITTAPSVGSGTGSWDKIIRVPTSGILGSDCTIDLSVYDGPIADFRAAAYWILAILTWLAGVNLFRSAFAGQ